MQVNDARSRYKKCYTHPSLLPYTARNFCGPKILRILRINGVNAEIIIIRKCLLTTPNLTVESLIRRNIIRRMSFLQLFAEFWAAEIFSYTVIIIIIESGMDQ